MRSGLWWVALGASLWGTDTFFRRPLTAHLSSTTIVLSEHLVLFVVLSPVLWTQRAHWRKLRGFDWAALIGIAWGGSALATMLFTEAVRLGNPTTAVLLQKSQPLFAALLAWFVLAEPLGPTFWIRFVVAMLGAYLINFGVQSPSAPVALTASLSAIAAAALWGSSTVLGRFLLRKLSFPTLTAMRVAAAIPLLVVLAAKESSGSALYITASDAATLVLLALIPGLAGLMIYYRGLANTYASRAAVAELCFPCTALLLNWMRFGTAISIEQGAGFILLAGAILSWQKEKSPIICETDCVLDSTPVHPP